MTRIIYAVAALILLAFIVAACLLAPEDPGEPTPETTVEETTSTPPSPPEPEVTHLPPTGGP
jgi:hypothetical protein